VRETMCVESPRNGVERRTKRRFPVEQEIRYKMLYGQQIAEVGAGRTKDMSSSGLWFTAASELPAGMPVELSMNWPVLLNDRCAMKLMIYGCIVRSDGKGAAVAIERYEFRTQGLRTFQQPFVATALEQRIAS
jgi:hypothetical protein